MPGRDRTGPVGMGPMTGRAAGFCAGNATSGFTGPSFGHGFGRRLGRGFTGGRGSRWGGFYPRYGYDVPPAGFYSQPGPQVNEVDMLKEQAAYLENALEGIKQRMSAIEAEKKAKE